MSSKYMILYDILKKNIISYIEQGVNQLPAERELCKIYAVSRQTVRNALKLLEDEGIIKRVGGSGAYITGIIPGVLSNNIALLISSKTDYLYPDHISRLENAFSNLGFKLNVYITAYDSAVERTILSDILIDPPRGIIVEPIHSAMPTPNYDLYQKLSTKKIPLLFINGYYNNITDSIYIKEDAYGGANLIGNYLLSLTHKKIAGIFQVDTISGHEKYLGLSRALIDSSINFSDKDVFWFNFSELINLRQKNDTRFLLNLISKNLMSYTAVVCQNDEIAYWLIKELELAHISVPTDISVISFDNSYLSSLSKQRITSLTIADSSIEQLIANKMIEILQGQFTSSSSIPLKIVYGDTCESIG